MTHVAIRTVGPVASLALAALAGCATLPNVQPEIAQAASERPADPAQTEAALRRWDERIGGRPFIAGNHVRLARNGPQVLPALVGAIQSAHSRIDMESYEFKDTEGAVFSSLLLQKRREGLQVDLVYDGWASADAAPLTDALRRGGVTVLAYNPIVPNGRVPLDLNDRDHRKLLVVDDSTAITGGVNITDVYRNSRRSISDDPDKMAWRDSDVVIEGPAVAEFQRLFLQTWTLQHGPALPPPPPTPQIVRGDDEVQALGGAPQAGRPEIYRALMVAITLARRSVHLTTGFFAPPPEMRRALEDAARRGVDVTLVLPSHSDSGMALAAGRASYASLLAAGVKLYERQGVVLHAKTAVIDGLWSAVGSSNLDWRSILFNSEIDAIILGHSFGNEMEASFRADIAQSHAISPAKWARRPMGERIDEWFATAWSRLL